MSAATDPYDLQRFLDAQDPVIDRVRAELGAGRKASHWMWFVFPQLAGLGSSAMARRYALAGAAEARAYLSHPVLGPRLRDLTALVTAIPDASARQVFGAPDDVKFRSCMTLFAGVAETAEDRAVFRRALARFFDGEEDSASASGAPCSPSW